MNGSAKNAPLRLEDAIVGELRDDLAAAEFFVAAVESLTGPTAFAALSRTQLIPARDVVQNELDNPLAALTALFILGMDVSNSELDAALPRVGAAGAERLGLIERRGNAGSDAVRAVVDLRPYSARDAMGEVDWWLTADLGEEVLGAQLPAHHVLGVGGAAKTLAGFTVRDSVKRALDLGTGSGIQALHLSRHSQEVIATDISRRALNFARFNLALNRVDPDLVELRSGSMLDPVADERFDLIVSNPPFVISPPNSGLPAYEYRDAAMRGDAVVEQLVTSVGAHLNPGGIAQFLGNWEHRAGSSWQERLSDWLEEAAFQGSALDAWIVEREVQDPAQYAETWLIDGGADPRRDEAGYERAYRAWLADFASRNVEQIGFGYILLRRAADESRPQLRRIEHVDTPVSGPLGGHVSRVLSSVDQLAALREGEIMQLHFECPADVTEERYGRPGDADPAMIFLRQGGGYGRSAQVSTWQSAFVGACDGELSAGQICGALAHLGGLEVAQIIAEVLPFIHQAVWGGFLHPAGMTTDEAGK